jgi:hypothetical protein
MALVTPIKRVHRLTDDKIAQVIELSALRAIAESREPEPPDPLGFFRALWLAMFVSALMWLVLAGAVLFVLSRTT